MKSSSSNPTGNILPSDFPEDQIESAVARSGYPLQTLVAVELEKHKFNFISEEWSYIDRGSNGKRALDLYAYKKLSPDTNDSELPYRGLVLLIECKRSNAPFVFFKSATQEEFEDFPMIVGMRSDVVEVNEERNNTMWSLYVPTAKVFGLTDHPFAASEPLVCNTFTKASRKGKELELSGSEPFNGIILPLVSALNHLYHSRKTQQGQKINPQLALAICVVDAPMVVADATQPDNDLSLTPWIRVTRQEVANDKEDRYRDFRHYFIDVVHADYLNEYLTQHLIPFSEFFSQKTYEP